MSLTILEDVVDVENGASRTQRNFERLEFAIRSFPSVATMLAATFADGELVNLTGYYTDLDGGGGRFKFLAAGADSANGGTIFEPDTGGGRLYREYSGRVNIRWFGAKGDGVTGDSAAILAAMGTEYHVLVPAGGDFFIDVGLTVAIGATLEFERSGRLLIDDETLTVNGGIIAGQWPIFTFASGATGNAAFSATPHIQELPVEWFGADPTYTGGDSTVAFQKWSSSPTANFCPPMTIGVGAFDVRGSCTFKGRVKVFGQGLQTSIRYNPQGNDETLFTFADGADGIEFHSLEVNNNNNLEKSGCVGFRALTNNAIEAYFYEVYIRDFNRYGVWFTNTYYLLFERCRISNTDRSVGNFGDGTQAATGILLDGVQAAYHVRFQSCRFFNNDRCIQAELGATITMLECSFEQNGDSGNHIQEQIWLKNIRIVNMIGNYLESNRSGTDANVRLDNCWGCNITGNEFSGITGGVTYSYGFIRLTTGTMGMVISGNEFADVLAYFILVDTVQYPMCRVFNNRFSLADVPITTVAGLASLISLDKIDLDLTSLKYLGVDGKSDLNDQVKMTSLNDNTYPALIFHRAVSNKEWGIHENNDYFIIRDVTAGVDRFQIDGAGAMSGPTSITTLGAVSGNLGFFSYEDASTTGITNALTVEHKTTGTAAIGFGTSILFRGERSDGTVSAMGYIAARWTNVTTGVESANLVLAPMIGSTGSGTETFWVFSSGGAGLGSSTDPLQAGVLNVNTGLRVGGIAETGKILIGDGINFVPKLFSEIEGDTIFSMPTKYVGLTFEAGVEGTALRSDARLALDQSIVPTWTSPHIFQKLSADVISPRIEFRKRGAVGVGGDPITPTVNYVSAWDAEYLANKSTFDAEAASGWGPTYYSFQNALIAALTMYEGTADTTYLLYALVWCESMVAAATITDTNGQKNWGGTWASPYSATNISHQIYDWHASTEMARCARIIHADSGLNATYGTRATAVYNFVKLHIVIKNLTTRGQYSQIDNFLTTTTYAVNDKALLVMSTLLDLKRSSILLGNGDATTYGWTASVADFADKLYDHGAGPNRWTSLGGGLIWDDGKGWEPPYTESDIAHANRMSTVVIELARDGIGVFDIPTYTVGLANLFTGTIWNGDMNDIRFNNFIDGTNTTYLTRGPWMNGLIYIGWATLAEYDQTCFEVCDAVLYKILNGSPTYLAYNDSRYGRICLSAHLQKASLAYGGGTSAGDSEAAILNNSGLGYLGFMGWDGAGYDTGVYMQAVASQDFTASHNGSRLEIYTAALNSSSPTLSLSVASALSTLTMQTKIMFNNDDTTPALVLERGSGGQKWGLHENNDNFCIRDMATPAERFIISHSTGGITTGVWTASVIAPAYLGSGSPSSSNFLRGDGTWATPSGGSGPVGAANYIQYYFSAGVFGASANFTWVDSPGYLTIGSTTRIYDGVIHNATDAILTWAPTQTQLHARGTNPSIQILAGDTPLTGLQIKNNGGTLEIGIFGATPVAKQAVTGSRVSTAALASLLTILHNAGYITDSSTT